MACCACIPIRSAASNLQVYITGHGGEDFFKFQDKEELSGRQLAHAFSAMHAAQRYKELLFIVDTCQAASLYAQVTAPNVLSIGSSMTGELCMPARLGVTSAPMYSM